MTGRLISRYKSFKAATTEVTASLSISTALFSRWHRLLSAASDRASVWYLLVLCSVTLSKRKIFTPPPSPHINEPFFGGSCALLHRLQNIIYISFTIKLQPRSAAFPWFLEPVFVASASFFFWMRCKIDILLDLLGLAWCGRNCQVLKTFICLNTRWHVWKLRSSRTSQQMARFWHLVICIVIG